MATFYEQIKEVIGNKSTNRELKNFPNIKEQKVPVKILELEEVKQFLRIDLQDREDDDYLNTIVIPSATIYVCNYTGLTEEEVANKKDLKSAILIVCSMMFDNRGAMVSSQVKLNPILTSILDMNSVNLL